MVWWRKSVYITETKKQLGEARGQLGVPLSCLRAHPQWPHFLLLGSPCQPLPAFLSSTIGQQPTFYPVFPWEMFKGQNIKYPFEWLRTYFKTDERKVTWLSDSDEDASSQENFQSLNSGLYPVSNTKEDLFFNKNYIWKKLISKLNIWVTTCIFGIFFLLTKIHVDVLKIQIISQLCGAHLWF